MMRKILCGAVALISLSSAHAASLNGTLFTHVTDDKAFYSPGSTANIRVAMTNSTGSAFSGRVKLAVCSRGNYVGFQYQDTSLAAGASQTLTFAQTVPSLHARAYHVVVIALAASNNSTPIQCYGSGTGNSSQIDTASGAINVAASAWEDPIEAFVDAPTVASSTVTAQQVADNLAQYHVSLVQGYDLAARHDQPVPSSTSWKNLAGVTLTQSQLFSYSNAFHGYGMKFLAYSLWNGAWSDYQTANPNVSLNMGLLTDACGASGGTCGISDQGSTGVGAGWPSWGWQSNGLYLMNPWNGRWTRWLETQFATLISSWGFDGIHLDTLGEDGKTYYDAKGRKINDMGGRIAWFANEVQQYLGVCTDINQVSGWNLQDEAVRGQSCNLYIEPHPEFANYPYFPSLNGLVEQLFEWTSRPLITAYYPQQVYAGVLPQSDSQDPANLNVCDPSQKGSSVCLANNPGIALLLGQVGVSGASQLMLGDYDHLTPGPFFPRATLGIDANLQEYLADYWNWFVGERDILRGHAVDSTDVINVTNSGGTDIGSSTGAAGKVYYRAITRAGIAGGASFTNLIGLKNNRIDDPDGLHKPTEQTNLTVVMEVYGSSPTGQLWYSAPDINHGFPQKLTYTVGTSSTNNGLQTYNITYTLPDLKTAAVVWLEANNLKGTTDWTLDATSQDFIRGAGSTWAPNGMGVSAAATVHGCCGRAIYWDGIDFGSGGVSTLSAVTYSQTGGTLEFRLDSIDGPLLGSLFAPSASSLATTTVNTQVNATGVHRVWVKFVGADVTLFGWRP